MKKKVLLLIVAWLLPSCIFTETLTEIRGIDLQILDNETNNPLSGIIVWYRLQKYRPNNFGGYEYETIILRRMRTDENGMVTIEPITIYLGSFQGISSESIFINLDIINEKIPNKISDHLNEYFLSSYRNNYVDEEIIIPNNYYYPIMLNYFPLDFEESYIIMQISDFALNDYDERFTDYPAFSELLEEDVKIIILLKNKNMLDTIVSEN